ncbi:hypothetical protein [Pseudalkalibacillus hwajinpoensis]|nr:hypothetical protein [Pseudalkalibacillus hwajinpoensis]
MEIRLESIAGMLNDLNGTLSISNILLGIITVILASQIGYQRKE